LSVAGSTTIYCTVTDTWTGVKSVTSNCVITWPVQTITQDIVISGSPTYNGSGQAYTLTPSTGPAPTGSPASFTNAGTYNSTNITFTPSAGYVVGTVTGSFTINKATISGTAENPSATYNAGSQSGTVITGVLPNVAPNIATYSGSVTASGTDAGSYTSSITGTGNYQGTVPGGTFTINKANLSLTSFLVYPFPPGGCGAYSVARMYFIVSGFQGADVGSLTTWIGTSSPTSVAPLSTNDQFDSNAVSTSTTPFANPIPIGNGTNDTSLYLCSNDGGNLYWGQVTGSANYNASGFSDPVDQQCGS
jgi:hypothetical protein